MTECCEVWTGFRTNKFFEEERIRKSDKNSREIRRKMSREEKDLDTLEWRSDLRDHHFLHSARMAFQLNVSFFFFDRLVFKQLPRFHSLLFLPRFHSPFFPRFFFSSFRKFFPSPSSRTCSIFILLDHRLDMKRFEKNPSSSSLDSSHLPSLSSISHSFLSFSKLIHFLNLLSSSSFIRNKNQKIRIEGERGEEKERIEKMRKERIRERMREKRKNEAHRDHFLQTNHLRWIDGEK